MCLCGFFFFSHVTLSYMYRDVQTCKLYFNGVCYYSCLKLLIEHNGDVHRTDQAKWTPLHWAATNGYEECCRLLLDSGARIDQTTDVSYFMCQLKPGYCLNLNILGVNLYLMDHANHHLTRQLTTGVFLSMIVC